MVAIGNALHDAIAPAAELLGPTFEKTFMATKVAAFRALPKDQRTKIRPVWVREFAVRWFIARFAARFQLPPLIPKQETTDAYNASIRQKEADRAIRNRSI